MLLFDDLKFDVIRFQVAADGHELRPLLLIRGVCFYTDEVDFTSPQREDGGRVGDDGDILRRAHELIHNGAFCCLSLLLGEAVGDNSLLIFIHSIYVKGYCSYLDAIR